jgi:fructose-1,6-bisphosphatase/sedoheptulose 1,7-bisphosphatase-like protein
MDKKKSCKDIGYERDGIIHLDELSDSDSDVVFVGTGKYYIAFFEIFM